MKKITVIQIITILTTILTITINGLANALPLNGQATGEISDRFAMPGEQELAGDQAGRVGLV